MSLYLYIVPSFQISSSLELAWPELELDTQQVQMGTCQAFQEYFHISIPTTVTDVLHCNSL